MNARTLRLWAAASITLYPLAGQAFDWSARIGLLYDRSDTWTDVGQRFSQPRLDIDLRLDARGDLGGRGVVDWGGSAAYRRTSTSFDGARTSLANDLTYRASAALFDHRRSPFVLSGVAERTDSRYEATTGQTVAGDRITDRYGGRVRLASPSASSVDVGYLRSKSEEEFGGTSRFRTNDLLSASMAHGVPAFNFAASFQGDWSDGTWVSDQYESQEVNATGTVRLGPDRDLVVVDRFYRREPTATAGPTYALDANAFRAFLRVGTGPGTSLGIQFSSQRSLSETPTSLDENRANSLRYNQDFRLAPAYFVRGVADASLAERRTSSGELRSGGGTLGAELTWRRLVETGGKLRPGAYAKRLYELSAGPFVGLLTVEGASPELGYGAVARARADFPWGERQVSGNYEVRYGSDLFGQPGWTIAQSGGGTLSGPAGEGSYSAQASLNAARSWSPLSGHTATRSALLLGRYGWHRYTAHAQLSLSNGVLPGTSGFLGDGIFIPLGFDTRQTTAALGGSVRFGASLVLRGEGRYSESVAPGQPDAEVLEGTASLTYRYAAFDFSIDDRYTRASQGGTQVRVNALFVRVSRTIGSRY